MKNSWDFLIFKARTQQLLQQNRELLDHIASLSGLNESDRPGLSSANIGMTPQVGKRLFYNFVFVSFFDAFLKNYLSVYCLNETDSEKKSQM